MTDTAPIDPDRPWIDDPDDAPAAMNWLRSFFDPLGETSRLHFTRAWTALFFARLTAFLGPVILVAILSGAGARDPQSYAPPAWFFPAFLIVTALISSVLHVRRLNNAGRSPLWAALVVLPVTIGLVGFLLGGMQGIQQYNEAVEKRNNPAPPPVIERTADAPVADASGEAAEGEAEPASDDEREGRGQGGEPLDVTRVSPRAHAFETALNTSLAFWALPSFFVMLWSLLWVGRLPNGGGTIRDRVARMRAEHLTERF